jgi:hypothetical protein
MSFQDFRRRAALVRGVPLETVLHWRGAVRDRQDRNKWHTEQGLLSVTGIQFMNWQCEHGGGGAIDLVMHLAGLDAGPAVRWLEQQLGTSQLAVGKAAVAAPSGARHTAPAAPRPLRLPARQDRHLPRVLRYLTRQRHLPLSLLEPLLENGKLYADQRGNAVFLMVAGKAQRPVDAELRGTRARIWRGMAPGSSKDGGYFWIGVSGGREIVLCESAIDAISCFAIYPDLICISTAGVRANPRWLSGLLAHDYRLQCGFDADAPGDAAAAAMITKHPQITRLRPREHDWNDVLVLED